MNVRVFTKIQFKLNSIFAVTSCARTFINDFIDFNKHSWKCNQCSIFFKTESFLFLFRWKLSRQVDYMFMKLLRTRSETQPNLSRLKSSAASQSKGPEKIVRILWSRKNYFEFNEHDEDIFFTRADEKEAALLKRRQDSHDSKSRQKQIRGEVNIKRNWKREQINQILSAGLRLNVHAAYLHTLHEPCFT